MDDDKIHEPRSTEQATTLAERFSELDGQIAAIEADRRHGLADVNARADRAANDLIARRDTIAAKLEAWWTKKGEGLTEGKRKSVELGGCMVGTRAGRSFLLVVGDEDATAARLDKCEWGKGLVRTVIKLDKQAIAAAAKGELKAKLKRMGLSIKPGETTFYVERVEQTGTLGG